MEKLEKLKNYNLWWATITLALPAAFSLFVPGFFGASDDLHIGWLYEMDKAIKMLQIPPRFVPDLSFGFGYPLFNFVFPLPFYIGEVFHLLGLNFLYPCESRKMDINIHRLEQDDLSQKLLVQLSAFKILWAESS